MGLVIAAIEVLLDITFDDMQELRLPPHPFKIESRSGTDCIFGLNRKKWLVLTPEEWVRQHWLAYLTDHLNYPAGRLSVEKSLVIGSITKRYDIVFYDSSAQPHMLVECKAPSIKIGQDTLEQAVRYNLALEAPFLLLSNGLTHHCLSVDIKSKKIEALKAIPAYSR